MKRIIVRYRVKPDYAATNEQRVRDVYEELGRVAPEGFHYGTFKLEDGVTFVHIAMQVGEQNPLGQVQAFQLFQQGLGGNCDEPPAVSELQEVGSYRFSADAS